jgi:hypothetical protein
MRPSWPAKTAMSVHMRFSASRKTVGHFFLVARQTAQEDGAEVSVGHELVIHLIAGKFGHPLGVFVFLSHAHPRVRFGRDNGHLDGAAKALVVAKISAFISYPTGVPTLAFIQSIALPRAKSCCRPKPKRPSCRPRRRVQNAFGAS